jgi:hypothetical protein
LTCQGSVVIIVFIRNCRTDIMNSPSPSQPHSSQPSAADVSKIRKWLELRQEMAELHAKLEYLKLMISLGVSR